MIYWYYSMFQGLQFIKFNHSWIFSFNPLNDVNTLKEFNPLTVGVAYIRVFIFYYHIKYHLLNMLKIKCDINQPYLKNVDLHFVESE